MVEAKVQTMAVFYIVFPYMLPWLKAVKRRRLVIHMLFWLQAVTFLSIATWMRWWACRSACLYPVAIAHMAFIRSL